MPRETDEPRHGLETAWRSLLTADAPFQKRVDWILEGEDGSLQHVVVDPAAKSVELNDSAPDSAGVRIFMQEHLLDELLRGALDEFDALARQRMWIAGPLTEVLAVIGTFEALADAYSQELAGDESYPIGGDLFLGSKPAAEMAMSVEEWPDEITELLMDQMLLVSLLLAALPAVPRAVAASRLWTSYEMGDLGPYAMNRLWASMGDLASGNSAHLLHRAEEQRPPLAPDHEEQGVAL